MQGLKFETQKNESKTDFRIQTLIKLYSEKKKSLNPLLLGSVSVKCPEMRHSD